MTTYEISSLSLETFVVIILVVEFWYDAAWNSREAQKKRRAKKQPQFDSLTTGEHR